jgi:hypothetical protein
MLRHPSRYATPRRGKEANDPCEVPLSKGVAKSHLTRSSDVGSVLIMHGIRSRLNLDHIQTPNRPIDLYHFHFPHDIYMGVFIAVVAV